MCDDQQMAKHTQRELSVTLILANKTLALVEAQPKQRLQIHVLLQETELSQLVLSFYFSFQVSQNQ